MIDSHSHIKINKNVSVSKKNIKDYLIMLKQNCIDEAIVTIDPFTDNIKCKLNSNHYVKMKSVNESYNIICKCTSCNKIIYEGIDPYIEYNNFLIENMSENKNINIFPVVAVTPNSLQHMIDFYISEYGSKIKGIKGYTGLSAYTLDDIEFLKSALPLLVHCGTYDNQNPMNMVNFASKFDNYLILAHLAALNIDSIKRFKEMDNVLIDLSPAKFIFDTYVKNNRAGGVFNKININTVDDMYEILANNFDINRIVWGSDFPYSDQKEELNTFLTSPIFSSTEKEKILCKNIKKVL